MLKKQSSLFLVITILANLFACFTVYATQNIASPILAVEKFDYTIQTDKYPIQDLVKSGIVGGSGWASNWSSSNTDFTKLPPKSGDGGQPCFRMKNGRVCLWTYEKNMPIYRQFSEKIDLNTDGEYFISAVAFQSFDRKVKTPEMNTKFIIGNLDLYGGLAYNPETKAYAARISMNGTPVFGTKDYQSEVFYKFTMQLSVKANGEDTLKLKISEDGKEETTSWDIAQTYELGNGSLDYFGFTPGGTLAHYVDDFVIEKYNSQDISNVDNMVNNLTQPTYNTATTAINTLPEGMAKSHYSTLLEENGSYDGFDVNAPDNTTLYELINSGNTSGNGWGSNWSSSSSDFSKLPVNGDGCPKLRMNNNSKRVYSYNNGASIYRKFKKGVSLNKDGEYFASGVFYQNIEPKDPKKATMDTRLIIGNLNIYGGLKYDGVSDKCVAQLSAGNSVVYGKIGYTTQKYFKYVINLSVKGNKEDTVRLKIFEINKNEPDVWELEVTVELGNGTLDFMGYNPGNAIAHYVDDITFEKYNSDVIYDMSNKIITYKNYEQYLDDFNKKLSDGMAKNHLKSFISNSISCDMLNYQVTNKMSLNSFLSAGGYGGIGWDSNWSGSNADFTVFPIESGAEKTPQLRLVNGRVFIFNYAQQAPIYRKLAKPIDLSQKGEYYISTVAMHNVEGVSQIMDTKFNLGSENIYYGMKYSAESGKTVAHISINGESVYGKKAYESKKNYKYILNIKSSESGTEVLRLKIFEEGKPESGDWDIVKNIELNDTKIGYIGFNPNANIAHYVDDFIVERYPTDKISELENLVLTGNGDNNLSISDAIVTALPDGLAREVLLSSLTMYSNIFNEEKVRFKDNSSKTISTVNSINSNLYAEYILKNATNNEKKASIILSIYENGKLIYTKIDVKTVAPHTDTELNTIGFDKIQVMDKSKCIVKLFVWDGDSNISPISNGYDLKYIVDTKENIYVSAFIVGKGDGSFAAPFGTIEEARDYIAKKKLAGEYPENGITVNFMKGSYSVPKSISFTSEDSGDVYKAYNNENVEFIGGTKVPVSEFKKVTDENILSKIPLEARAYIKKINLNDYNINNYSEMPVFGHSTAYYDEIGIAYPKKKSIDLFFDGNPMTVARYPNNGYMTISDVIDKGSVIRNWCDDKKETNEYIKLENREIPPKGIKFNIEDNRALNWGNASDARIHGYFKFDWSDLSMKVKTISNKTIESLTPSPYGVEKGKRFYIYNLIEELDSDKEWYLDCNNGDLYIYSQNNEGDITISTLDKPIISMDNCQNIKFSNIKFCISQSNGIEINNCRNIVFENIEVSNTIEKGINIIKSSECVIKNSTIFNNGAGGISVNGGDNKSLIPSNNKIINNEIYDFSNRVKTYSPAVAIGGVGNIVSNNKIHNSPHMAISFIGNDNVISNNEIYNVLNEASDMGAIYSGRTKVGRGNTIKNNYIHSISSNSTDTSGIYGIYLDDLLDGTTVSNNIISNINGTAIFLNGGRDNVITNNISVSNNYILRSTACGIATNYNSVANWNYHGYGTKYVNYKNPPYDKYVHLPILAEDDPLAPKYNQVKNNIGINQTNDIRWSDHQGVSVDYLKSLSDYKDSYLKVGQSIITNLLDIKVLIENDAQLPRDFVSPNFDNIGT